MYEPHLFYTMIYMNCLLYVHLCNIRWVEVEEKIETEER